LTVAIATVPRVRGGRICRPGPGPSPEGRICVVWGRVCMVFWVPS